MSMTLAEINRRLAEAGQRIDALSVPATMPAPTAAETTWWSVTSAMTISAAVLVFGLLVLLLAAYLIRVGKNTEAVLRIFGTILIVVIAVFLVVAGYTDTQIAPVMGLLGTIAGYLLGKDTKDN